MASATSPPSAPPGTVRHGFPIPAGLPAEQAGRAARRRSTRDAVENLVLPPFSARARDGLWFAAVTFGIFSLILPFLGGDDVALKVGLNLARVFTLFACYRAMPAEATTVQAYVFITIGASVVFGTSAVLSLIRREMGPQVVFHLITLTTAATMLPWGARAQTLLSSLAAASILVTAVCLDPANDHVLSVEGTAASFVAFGIGIGLSAFLERSRAGLRAVVEDARRADEELENLYVTLEERVAQRTHELEVANRELEGFSFTVSHDLRGPLRTVGGYSQLVLEESTLPLDEITRERIQRIHAASLRMDGIIDDMLVLARIGRAALRIESVDIGVLAQSILDELRAEEPGRRVESRVGELPRVEGDRALLRVALDNLLRNAWKFTANEEVARITVYATTDGDRVRVHVIDNGIGFDMRFRAKLYRPFERIHDDPSFEGTGVGLATVARIVDRRGGRVDATGVPGEGATFSITLPASHSSAPSTSSR